MLQLGYYNILTWYRRETRNTVRHTRTHPPYLPRQITESFIHNGQTIHLNSRRRLININPTRQKRPPSIQIHPQRIRRQGLGKIRQRRAIIHARVMRIPRNIDRQDAVRMRRVRPVDHSQYCELARVSVYQECVVPWFED